MPNLFVKQLLHKSSLFSIYYSNLFISSYACMRYHVASNLIRRPFYVMCPLGIACQESIVIFAVDCTARQCSPVRLRRKFMDCSIINPARSLLVKHLVIGQRQKAPNFSAFHLSPHGSLVSFGQHFVATMVVYLPKRTEQA